MCSCSSILHYPDGNFVQHIIETHLHPEHGAPYWLRRDQALRADAFHRVHSFTDLKRYVGFRNHEDQRRFENDTRFLPLETFIPEKVLRDGRTFWASQTGGTTGPPKHGSWDSRYWQCVLELSDEFLDSHGLPRDVNWLFMGPTGPHTTGRLVTSIAENRGGRCFTIDLDPRIVKIFDKEGMHAASTRYVRHLWEQIEPIIRYQNIKVFFCTSRLLEMLPAYLDLELFKGLRGIVHAGTTMGPDTQRILAEELFPHTPIVGMYGTSTTGISYQKLSEDTDSYRVVYIPSSPHIVLEIVGEDGQLVEYGQEGNVATYRLTEDYLIPGFWERDRATRVKPYGAWADRYPWDWIGDPFSPQFTVEGQVEGVY